MFPSTLERHRGAAIDPFRCYNAVRRVGTSTPPSAIEEPDISTPRYLGHTALILEDNFIIGLAFKVQLEDMGFAVLGPASTLDDARGLLESQTPTVALLDINLGHESSNGLAQELLASGVPVVFVTGYDTARGVEPALAAVPCVRKPVDPMLLRRALDRALGL